MARYCALGLCVVLVVLPLSRIAGAAEGDARQRRPLSAELDFFEAIRTGEIEARFVPRDAASGTVLLTNKADRPLTIRLPEAFAGVPIQAQIGGNGLAGIGGNNPNGGTGGGNGGNQSVGGGFGGGGLGGLGGAGGVFSIDSGRARKLKVVSVCLDHGKREPAPRIPYELVPLNHRTGDGQVIELIKMLGRGDIDQPAAQGAGGPG